MSSGKKRARRHRKSQSKRGRRSSTTNLVGTSIDLALGRRIRDVRKKSKMSLEAIGAHANLSIGFLSQIERGLSSPSLRVLTRLADVLGVDIVALLSASLSEIAGASGMVTRHLNEKSSNQLTLAQHSQKANNRSRLRIR